MRWGARWSAGTGPAVSGGPSVKHSRVRLGEWRWKGAGLPGQWAPPLPPRVTGCRPQAPAGSPNAKGEGSGSQAPLHRGAQGPPAGMEEATFRDPRTPPLHMLDLIPLCCLLLALIAFLKSW